MRINPDDLTAFPLFANLAATDLERIARWLRRVVFPTGAVVMGMEQPGEAAYLIAEGALQVVVDRSDGGGVILAVLGPGALVGEIGVVQSAGRSATVVAHERAVLLAIDHDDFHTYLRSCPIMAFNLTGILAQRLRLANAQILTLATPEIDERVARMLVTFAREHGQSQPDGSVRIPFRLTQSDLARLIGAARASVNKVIGSLTRAGALATDSQHRITVRDLAALERMCE